MLIKNKYQKGAKICQILKSIKKVQFKAKTKNFLIGIYLTVELETDNLIKLLIVNFQTSSW